jgi:hypothetical protein
MTRDEVIGMTQNTGCVWRAGKVDSAGKIEHFKKSGCKNISRTWKTFDGAERWVQNNTNLHPEDTAAVLITELSGRTLIWVVATNVIQLKWRGFVTPEPKLTNYNGVWCFV